LPDPASELGNTVMEVFGGSNYKTTRTVTDVNVVAVVIAMDEEYRVPWPVDKLPKK